MYNQRFFAVTKGDEIAVYKKCCFTKDCNLPSAFEEEIQGLRRAKLEEADPRRTDTDVISSLVIIVIALLVVYSVYKAWRSFEKEKERSPDYLQELNPDLVQAAFQNGIEHGPEVRGELSLKENAAVLMVMMFPPKQESQSTSSSDTRVTILPPRVMQAAGNGHTLVKVGVSSLVLHRSHSDYSQPSLLPAVYSLPDARTRPVLLSLPTDGIAGFVRRGDGSVPGPEVASLRLVVCHYWRPPWKLF